MTSPAPDHYFRTPDEATTTERRTLDVRLAGHEVEVTTAGNVFSGERVDLGTRVLLREVPAAPPSGDLLDLGCGWGPLTLVMALQSPKARVWAVDVNALALELTAANAARLQLKGVRTAQPDDVPSDVRFTTIWSNPPIRVGKEALHTMLLRWLPRLVDGGTAWLVVQRNLGADSLHQWLVDHLPAPSTWEVARAGSAKGYRVLSITRRD